jgi:hypothetical protein
MACRPEDITEEQLHNLLNDWDKVFETYPNQPVSYTLKILSYLKKNLEMVEVETKEGTKEKYKLGDRIFDLRVSDEAKKHFRQMKGNAYANEASKNPINILKAKGGTQVHKVMEHLVNALVNPETAQEELKKALEASTEGQFKISSKDFKMLQRGAKKLVDQIQAYQNKINKRTGKEGEVIILTEVPVADSQSNRGGTLDVLAIFSDNTAGVFDYKVIGSNARQRVEIGGEQVLVDELIYGAKLEGYTKSMPVYSEMLEKVVGIKKIRYSRLVPIHALYNFKDTNNPKIVKLEMGEDINEHLEQIPIMEAPDTKELITIVEQQFGIMSRLQAKLNAGGLSNDEWTETKKEIDRIKKSIKAITIKGDLSELIIDLAESIQKFYTKMEEPELLPSEDENGMSQVNPEYLRLKELEDFRHKFSSNSELVSLTRGMIAEMKELDQEEEAKKLETQIDEISLANEKALDLATSEKISRVENMLAEHGQKAQLDENGHIKDQKPLGIIEKFWARESEIDHPIFKTFVKIKDKTLYKIRNQVINIEERLIKGRTDLRKWAKENGISLASAYKKLIDENTGNLYHKHTKEWVKQREDALENKNITWVKKNYELRDKAAFQESYLRRKKQQEEYLKKVYNNLKDRKIGGQVVKTAKDYKFLYERDLGYWEKQNNLLKEDEAWFNQYNRRHIKLKEEVSEANLSDEFKYIMNNKPLYDFYKLMLNLNYEYKKAMGLNYRDFPYNLVPNIRKSIIERAVGDNIGNISLIGAGQEILDSMRVREEDTMMAIREEDGSPVKNIPKLFLHPFRNKEGDIDNSMKSFDLAKSMLYFGKMAYTYKYMNEIEAQTLALKDTLGKPHHSSPGEQVLTSKGERIKSPVRRYLTKKAGLASDTARLFEKFVNFHLYGIRFEEKGKTKNVLGREINSVKATLQAKQYLSLKVLGLSVIPGTAAFIAGKAGSYIIAKKGIAYTEKQFVNATKLWATDHEKYLAFSKYFDFYAEDMTYRKATKLSQKPITRWLSTRNLFVTLRGADERVTNQVAVSMAQNYGIDSEGNLVRLNRKGVDENIKPLWDTVEIKDGKLVFNPGDNVSTGGMTDSAFISFRNAVRSVTAGIVGSMNDEDISQTDTNLTLNLLMHFRTWMPGVLEERFGKFKYDEDVQALKAGRFVALASEFGFTNEQGQQYKKFRYYVQEVVLPKLGGIILDLGTFGIAPRLGLKRVNERKAKFAFQRWKAENPETAENVTFEEFLEIKQAQIKAAMVEMRMILLFLGVIAFLGAEGDDGEPRYYSTWAGRQLYKVLNRGHSELSFAWNPTEFIRLVSNPLPLSSLLADVYKTLSNTIEVALEDLNLREINPQDKTPRFYYSSQWIIGMNQLRRIVELYEQDKKNQY